MNILTALRERLSPHDSSVTQTADAHGDSVTEGQLPLAGYDRLDARQVVDGLSDRSQVELEAVEGYERSHKSRASVLDKLRYMRGREPIPGYDALSTEKIVAALEEADLATVKKVRGYERKFGNRRAVLEQVVRIHDRRHADQPASPPPAYQPVSARSSRAASGLSDRPAKSGRP